MRVVLDISKGFSDQFHNIISADDFDPDSGYDNDKIKAVKFPDGVEFYHFEAIEHKAPVYMTSTNPKDSEWYLIHINIGIDTQLKQMERAPQEYQKFIPSGILVYCPGIVIKTHFPAGHRSELASIRIPKAFLDNYYEKSFIQEGQLLVCEDLTYGVEQEIHTAIAAMSNKLKCHAMLLGVIERIFAKINSNSLVPTTVSLHSDDINRLLLASGHLRNPLLDRLPSIKELAETAKMSPSKFKASFKQFFGQAPHQYHFKIKMEYARRALKTGAKTPVEVSNDLGYSHPSNFTSAYKNYFGTLPSADFRKA